MYHSITFGDKNTWDDWHLVPASRPTFSMPPLQERYVDIPGLNGPVDLTEAITGYPVYGNRTGSFEFIVMNDWYDSDGTLTRGRWQERYSEIANYLHGRSMKAWLEDDPEYYYEGRFKLAEWRSEKDYSRISIEYNVGPYKWYSTDTSEPWLWDPFSFETGVIGNGVYTDDDYYSRTDTITTEESPLTFSLSELGYGESTPLFLVAADPSSPDNFVRLNLRDEHGLWPVNVTVGTQTTIDDLRFVNGHWDRGYGEAELSTFSSTGTASLTTQFTRNYAGGEAFEHIELTTSPISLTFSETYPEDGLWPLHAAGTATVMPIFTLTGTGDGGLSVAKGGADRLIARLSSGVATTAPGLVLHQGEWIYNGTKVKLDAFMYQGTGSLSMRFRKGML